MSANNEKYDPEILLIFLGFSKDAIAAADILYELQSTLDAELDKYREVNSALSYRRVKIWRWDKEAESRGGQKIAIDPYLQRANIAVFVFKEKCSPTVRQEVTDSRARNPEIPMFAFLPSTAPKEVNTNSGAEDWLTLLAMKRFLVDGWTAKDSLALTPVKEYEDIFSLRKTAFDLIARSIRQLAKESVSESSRQFNEISVLKKIPSTVHAINDYYRNVFAECCLMTNIGTSREVEEDTLKTICATISKQYQMFIGGDCTVSAYYRYIETEQEFAAPFARSSHLPDRPQPKYEDSTKYALGQDKNTAFDECMTDSARACHQLIHPP